MLDAFCVAVCLAHVLLLCYRSCNPQVLLKTFSLLRWGLHSRRTRSLHPACLVQVVLACYRKHQTAGKAPPTTLSHLCAKDLRPPVSIRSLVPKTEFCTIMRQRLWQLYANIEVSAGGTTAASPTRSSLTGGPTLNCSSTCCFRFPSFDVARCMNFMPINRPENPFWGLCVASVMVDKQLQTVLGHRIRFKAL